jgi:hypothetical protein
MVSVFLSASAVCSCSDTRTTAEVNREEPAMPTAILDSTSFLVLGRDDQSPLHQVIGAILLGETIVVGEASTHSLRFYDREGQLLKVSGRYGEGPGEFRSLSWIRLVGMNLFAYDPGLQRISVFDLRGGFLRATRLPVDQAAPQLFALGVFSDGSIVAQASAPTAPVRSGMVVRREFSLLRYHEEGRVWDTLGSYQGTETYLEPFGRGGELRSVLPFGRKSGVAVGRSSVYVVENNGPWLRVIQSDGSETPNVELATGIRIAISESDKVMARARFAEDENGSLSGLDAVFDRMPIPEVAPWFGWEGTRALDLIRVTASGDLWVVNHGGTKNLHPTWTVIRGTGEELGRVTSTEEVRILDYDSDSAVVLCWDETGVETVELRRVLW